MSNIYNYDVFLACPGKDRNTARLLAQKLREVNFHVWLDEATTPNHSANAATALEDSAVCILLMGAGGNLSWMDDSQRSVIRKRLQSTDRVLRIITVFLPSTYSRSNLIRPHPFLVTGGQSRSTYVHFRKSLDEKDSLHELILRIRGINPKHEASSNGSFKSAVQLRTQNALNVDWYNLALDVHFSSSRFTDRANPKASLPHQVFPIKHTNPSQRGREFWSPHAFTDYGKPIFGLRLVPKQTPCLPTRFLSIRSVAAIAAMLLALIGVLAHLDGRYVEVVPNPNVVVEQSPPGSTKASNQGVDKSEKKKRSPGATNVVAARTQPWSNSTEWRDRVRDFVESSDHASYSRTSQTRVLRDSDAALPSGYESRSGFTAVYKRKFKQRQQERFASVINPKGINQKPQAFILSSDIGDEPTKAGTERTNDASRDVLLSSNEVSRGAKDPERWKTFDRSKLAQIKEIYVEFSNDADIDAELRSRVITGFIKPLQENGVEVVSKKEERDVTYGIAKLRFGEREMKSGVVSVDIEDSKGQVIKRFFAPATCTPLNQNALVKILCDASQILGDKLSDALQNAEQQ